MFKKSIRVGGFALKLLWKLGIATAGVTAFTNPISATIAGVSAVASAVSAVSKDRNIKPVMSLVNILALNIDKAKNDSSANS